MSDNSQKMIYSSATYSVRTGFNEATGEILSFTWTNARGLVEAPGDLPAEVRLRPGGTLLLAFWKRAGEMHRDGDLPAAIYFDDEGRPRSWGWRQNGFEHRDGDKPSFVSFTDGSLTQLRCLEFYRNGSRYRSGGKPSSIEIFADGKMLDSDAQPVEFDSYLDPAWLPSPLPTLTIPQPFLLKPLCG